MASDGDDISSVLDIVKLQSLMSITSGHQNITIGLIDGPIDFTHPAFQGLNIDTITKSQYHASCKADSLACTHGTFVTGILCAKRESLAPALAPKCKLLLRPVFNDDVVYLKNNNRLPSTNPAELSDAIIEAVDADVKVINLSLGLSSPSLTYYANIDEAVEYARRNDIIIVAAAGTQSILGRIPLFANQWVIPVVACDLDGRPYDQSNFGPSIGRNGLMAPGINIRSTSPGGGYTNMSGSSAAAPFVTGAVALLWSFFPNAQAEQIRSAILRRSSRGRLRALVPLLMDAEEATKSLRISLR